MGVIDDNLRAVDPRMLTVDQDHIPGFDDDRAEDKPFLYTVFTSMSAQSKTEHSAEDIYALAEFVKAAEAPSKDALPWIKLIRFGEARTEKNALRHDANVDVIYGVEGDYDDGRMSPQEFAQNLAENGVEALVVTTASHTPESPRWRVLSLFDQPIDVSGMPKHAKKEVRARLLERLSRAGGCRFAGESYTLSQSYYFGRITGRDATFYCEVVDGDPVDTLTQLDDLPLPPAYSVTGQRIECPPMAGDTFKDFKAAKEAMLSGANVHAGARHVSMSMLSRDYSEDDIRAEFDQWADVIRDVRGNERVDRLMNGELTALIEDALKKLNDTDALEVLDPPVQNTDTSTAGNTDTETEPAPRVHALAQFIPINEVPRPPEFLIENVIAAQLSAFASYPGKGKTSAWVSVSMITCGAMVVEGLPVLTPRHVVYVAEDVEQVQGIVSGLISIDAIDRDIAYERFHLVRSKRMRPSSLVKVAPYYEALAIDHTRNDVTTIARPYLVLDTGSSTMDVDDENDNAAWGKAIATIKESLDIPATIVLHTSKAHKRGKAEDMTIRGASAIEGDVAQVMFLSVDDDNNRYIEIAAAKHRFEASVAAIKINSQVVDLFTENVFGEPVVVPTRVALLEPLTSEGRAEAKAAAEKEMKERNHKEQVIEAREAIKAYLLDASDDQKKITTTEGMSKAQIDKAFPTIRVLRDLKFGTQQVVRDAVAGMKGDGMLIEVAPEGGIRLPGGRKFIRYATAKIGVIK